MREKERRGNVTILFPHLCFRVASCSSYRESLELSLSYTSGNFHFKLACIFQRWASSNALGLHEQASWMQTHLVSSLSFHTLIALSASVAWQSLLLTLTSIYGHLHSPLISRVDVKVSPFLSSPHNLHHHILFHL